MIGLSTNSQKKLGTYPLGKGLVHYSVYPLGKGLVHYSVYPLGKGLVHYSIYPSGNVSTGELNCVYMRERDMGIWSE